MTKQNQILACITNTSTHLVISSIAASVLRISPLGLLQRLHAHLAMGSTINVGNRHGRCSFTIEVVRHEWRNEVTFSFFFDRKLCVIEHLSYDTLGIRVNVNIYALGSGV